jgi:predicted RNA-binding Zn-ribbon protein involved in translation (DUF1610 family)
MRITRNAVVRSCAICERTLLMGERATRFAPEPGDELVDVCPLCHEVALEYGWVKEGTPTVPTLAADRRRGRGPSLLRFFAPRREEAQPVVAEPILRRLSEDELALVQAADLFNASDHRRTVGGIAKSLGPPRASIVLLAGVNPGVVVTFAWDVSWYQYRVAPDSAQPVRLAERGHDPAELDSAFTHWNARVENDGRVAPNVNRV